MKRSIQVCTPLLAAAALTLISGCRKPQMQRCVDEENHVVDDKFCQNLSSQQPGAPAANGIGFVPYHFYYGGFGGYNLGSVVTGGSTIATPGVSYTTRGGFGSSFGGAGAHGEGAGE